MRPGALIGLLLLVACGRPAGGPIDAGSAMDAGGLPGVFLALDRDFANYRSWPRFVLPGGDDAGFETRWVYVNRLPPAGAATFPDGTILVKESFTTGTVHLLEIDAMSKRGGGFNSGDGGASGWEWLGLSSTDDERGGIIGWRGIAPPPGVGSYGGISGGTCNACHGLAAGNDYVQVPADGGADLLVPLILHGS